MFVSHRVRPWVLVMTVAATAALLASTAAPSAARNRQSNHGKVAEAVVTAFTGPEAFIGGVLTAGAYPAAWEINKGGGVNGQKFEIKTVDTRGDPADALPLVERFLGSTGNLVGITGTDGATANQLLPVFNKHKLTTISDVGSNNFDHTKMKYFWRMIAPDPVNGLAMAYWAKREGYKRVALVFGSDTSAQTDLPGIQYGVKHLGLQVVANITLTPDQPSYQSDAAKLLAANPQAIFTEEDATTAGTFFGDVAQLGTVPKIIGDSGTIENDWMSAVAGAIGSSTFANNYVGLTPAPAKKTSAHKAWVRALRGAKGNVKSPVNQWFNEPYAEAVYDGMIMQALAMVASKSNKPARFNRFIKAVSEPGKHKKIVHNFKAGKRLLLKGKKIRYVGVTGPVAFNKWHNFYGDQIAASFPTATLTSEKVKGVIPAGKLEAAG